MQRHRENLCRYSFTVRWEPGKRNQIADAPSRYPAFDPEEEIDEAIATTRLAKFKDLNLEKVKQEALSDMEYQAIVNLMKTGQIPDKHDQHPANLYNKVWHELSIEGPLIIKDGSKIVIPKEARMKELYYWPGMTSDIRNMVEACRECQRMQPSQTKQEWKERE